MQSTKSKVVRYRNDAEFYYTYGVKAFKEKRFDRAEKWLLKALEEKPTHALYLSQLSVLYTEIGQYHRANDVLQKVIDHHGSAYGDCYYLLANNYAHLGLFYEAKKFALKYLETHEDGEFKEEVSELLALLNQLSTEEEDEEDFEMDNLDELIIYQETAFYHLEHEDWDEAIEILEELMLLYPEYLSAKHEYAFALFQKGDQEEALTLEETWFSQDPISLHSRLNLVYFYYSLGQSEEFEELLSTLFNVYPTYEPQKLKLAVTMARIGEYEEALQRFKQIDPKQVANYMSYYYWFAKALSENNLEEYSRKIWEQGIKRHPMLDSFK